MTEEHIKWMDNNVPRHAVFQHEEKDFRKELYHAAKQKPELKKRLIQIATTLKTLSKLPEYKNKLAAMQKSASEKKTPEEKIATFERHITRWANQIAPQPNPVTTNKPAVVKSSRPAANDGQSKPATRPASAKPIPKPASAIGSALASRPQTVNLSDVFKVSSPADETTGGPASATKPSKVSQVSTAENGMVSIKGAKVMLLGLYGEHKGRVFPVNEEVTLGDGHAVMTSSGSGVKIKVAKGKNVTIDKEEVGHRLLNRAHKAEIGQTIIVGENIFALVPASEHAHLSDGFSLLAISGKHEGKRFDLRAGQNKIGAAESSAVQLSGIKIKPTHLILAVNGNQVKLLNADGKEGLASNSEVTVNGLENKKSISPSSILGIHDHEFLLLPPKEPGASNPTFTTSAPGKGKLVLKRPGKIALGLAGLALAAGIGKWTLGGNSDTPPEQDPAVQAEYVPSAAPSAPSSDSVVPNSSTRRSDEKSYRYSALLGEHRYKLSVGNKAVNLLDSTTLSQQFGDDLESSVRTAIQSGKLPLGSDGHISRAVTDGSVRYWLNLSGYTNLTDAHKTEFNKLAQAVLQKHYSTIDDPVARAKLAKELAKKK